MAYPQGIERGQVSATPRRTLTDLINQHEKQIFEAAEILRALEDRWRPLLDPRGPEAPPPNISDPPPSEALLERQERINDATSQLFFGLKNLLQRTHL